MKRGFSLLEVILALTLLAGTVVVLGEVCRIAMKNAAAARDLARAQMLCESKLSEILSGITPASASDGSFDPSTEPAAADGAAWIYKIETQPTDEEGLISVRVRVTKDLPEAQHPVDFSLVRWMTDPNSSTEESSGGTSSTNSSGGTSNGG